MYQYMYPDQCHTTKNSRCLEGRLYIFLNIMRISISFFWNPMQKIVLEIDATVAHEEAMEKILATNLQCQTKCLLKSLFRQIGLGFRNTSEESMLKTFVCSYSNVLCFVERHWKSFFRAEFPCIPPMHRSCMSLQLLALTNRK